MGKKMSDYNLTKRADGRWYVQVMVDGNKTYLYGKTQSELRTKLKAKLFDIEQAQAARLANYHQADKVTVEQWARLCLSTYSKISVRGSTYSGYLSIVNNHLEWLGSCKLSEVTNAMIQEHLQSLAKKGDSDEGLGEKSLLNIKNFLSWIFNQAIKNGMLIRNPVTGVKVPKTGTKETRALSIEEQQRILTAAREYDKHIMFAVVFALYTGCRKSEILGLQWRDVDFSDNCIHISKQLNRTYDMTETSDTKTVLELSTPKTKNSIRDIYMFQSFAEEVKAYKEKMIVWKKEKRYLHSEDDFVFIGMKGKPIEPRVFYKYYQEVMKIADVEDANFHTLRHTFATRCIENGMDILMVSRTLGHSNISTTLNKYSHLLPKHQKACMDKLETIYF
ncbi:MAG TPA: hypothetical protein DEB10_07730 [Ruminococcaceae bacterium]|nr:hypothetical protein [Oscillospiraceae bacterium]